MKKSVSLEAAKVIIQSMTGRTLLGMIRSSKVILTKTGKKMAFALLEDNSGTVELVFFTDVWEAAGSLVVTDAVLGIEGKAELKRGDPKIIVERVLRPEEMKTHEPREVHIKVAPDYLSEENLYNLRSSLIEHNGNCTLFIHIDRDEEGKKPAVIRASSQIKISSSDKSLETLKNHEGIMEVWRV